MRKWIIAALVAAFVVAGCKSTDTQEAAPVDEGTSATAAAGGAGGATTSGVGAGGVSGTNLGPGAGTAKVPPATGVYTKRIVLFDFDSFVVKDEYRPTVEAHARYLNANKTRRVVIQGNTDERGSREYNLALGQKRAEAVRKSLAALGVSDSQMEAVSFGEEKPKSTGSDEAAWAENRRADLVY